MAAEVENPLLYRLLQERYPAALSATASLALELAEEQSLCYVKVKGQNPLFYVFYLFSLLAPHFCLTKTKILHLQFLAVLFQNL